MLWIVLTIIASTLIGLFSERRWPDQAGQASRRSLVLMLYLILPPIIFVNLVHVEFHGGVGIGLGLGLLSIATVGVVAWFIAVKLLKLSRPSAGAVIVCSLLANSSFLGYPMVLTLMGGDDLTEGVVYDVLVNGMSLMLFAFGVGAAFGTKVGEGMRERVKAFFFKNPLLVTDPFLATQPMTQAALQSLRDVGIGAGLFSDIKPNPIDANIEAGIKAMKAGKHDSVIAFGGGFQLALGADIRFVHPDAVLSVMEVRWGIVPDMTGIPMLVRLVGLDVAKELTFTARRISGTEAHELGLATHLSEDPRADAFALAREIAGRNPDAVRGAKQLLDQVSERTRAEAFLEESRWMGQLLGTPNQMRDYVKDGTVKEFALWNPADLGYLAAYATKALIDGDITGAEGDTFTAGDLGEFTVGENGSVLLGDPYRFNADNIDDFDF